MMLPEVSPDEAQGIPNSNGVQRISNSYGAEGIPNSGGAQGIPNLLEILKTLVGKTPDARGTIKLGGIRLDTSFGIKDGTPGGRS